MFGFLKKVGKAAAQVAVPLAISIAEPAALINTAVMGGVKNATPINNQSIPFVNLLLSTGVSFGRQVASGIDPLSALMPAISEGGLLTAASTGLHQSVKIPVRARTGKSI